MPRATATVAAPPVTLPRIRLRSVLALGMALGLGLWVQPRASAAWRLHTLANRYADYAACVAGPTGPTALRDDPERFAELLRRRIVTARPGETPFAGCEKQARGLDVSASVAAAHRLEAQDFVEYGGSAADRARAPGASAGEASLASILVSTDRLAELAHGAWPFVRTGHARLMKPSSHTSEAVHPVEAPAPGIGSGLPLRRSRYRTTFLEGDGLLVKFGSGANQEAFRSADGGVSWQAASVPHEAAALDGCQADARGKAFVFTFDGPARRVIVMSLGPERAPFPADLASADAKVVGAACDAKALVVALRESASQGSASPGEGERVVLRLCPYAAACTTLAAPDFGKRGLGLDVDVARVDGTTVVSSQAHGVTRVSSSRDQGRTWSPPAVAFDSAVVREDGLEMPAPVRMLTAGSRLFLYGGGRRSEDAYWLLVSDDHGASFHAP